jgi:hypothetical protein
MTVQAMYHSAANAWKMFVIIVSCSAAGAFVGVGLSQYAGFFSPITIGELKIEGGSTVNFSHSTIEERIYEKKLPSVVKSNPVKKVVRNERRPSTNPPRTSPANRGARPSKNPGGNPPGGSGVGGAVSGASGAVGGAVGGVGGSVGGALGGNR